MRGRRAGAPPRPRTARGRPRPRHRRAAWRRRRARSAGPGGCPSGRSRRRAAGRRPGSARGRRRSGPPGRSRPGRPVRRRPAIPTTGTPAAAASRRRRSRRAGRRGSARRGSMARTSARRAASSASTIASTVLRRADRRSRDTGSVCPSGPIVLPHGDRARASVRAGATLLPRVHAAAIGCRRGRPVAGHPASGAAPAVVRLGDLRGRRLPPGPDHQDHRADRQGDDAAAGRAPDGGRALRRRASARDRLLRRGRRAQHPRPAR